jgi:hypothetical protein
LPQQSTRKQTQHFVVNSDISRRSAALTPCVCVVLPSTCLTSIKNNHNYERQPRFTSVLLFSEEAIKKINDRRKKMRRGRRCAPASVPDQLTGCCNPYVWPGSCRTASRRLYITRVFRAHAAPLRVLRHSRLSLLEQCEMSRPQDGFTKKRTARHCTARHSEPRRAGHELFRSERRVRITRYQCLMSRVWQHTY